MVVTIHHGAVDRRPGESRRLVSTTAGRRQHGTDAGVAPSSVGVSVPSTQRTPPTNHIPPTAVSAADHTGLLPSVSDDLRQITDIFGNQVKATVRLAFTLAEQPTSSNKIAVLRRGYSGCQEAGK